MSRERQVPRALCAPRLLSPVFHARPLRPASLATPTRCRELRLRESGLRVKAPE